MEGLYWAMGEEKRNDAHPQFTDHCFTGDYPTPLVDHTSDRAAKDFDRALAIQPNSAQVYFNRAMLHFAQKNYDRAWSDVQRGQDLGGTANPKFIQALTEASGQTK